MAVNRVSATLARRQQKPYTTLLNDTLDLIVEPIALAVYVYLQSKPSNWIVRRKDIMDRFNIGRDRYQGAVKHLIGLGLAEYEETRNEQGQLLGKSLIINYTPESLKTNTEEQEAEDLKNRPPEKPNNGKSGPLVIEGLVINEMSNTNEMNNINGKADFDECLTYLRIVTGRSFRNSSDLSARLKDYSVSDIKSVIDYKSKEWMGTDMQKYLRPQTLFNKTKFEGYLNDAKQGVITKSGKPEKLDQSISVLQGFGEPVNESQMGGQHHGQLEKL